MSSDSSPLERLASLKEDGTRKFIYPADVHGKYNRARRAVFAILITVLMGLPWVRIGGKPAMLFDIPGRRFFLFGEAFNAQDGWLVFFVLAGLGFSLVVTTAIFGRVWCGWACPQTVFIDGLYRRIERWVEGPSSERMKLASAPWSPTKIRKFALKHGLYVAVSILLAHVVLGYFVPVREMWSVVTGSPLAHLEAFAWTMSITGLLYFNFGWFREQFCVVMCPYGRLQSTLTDEHSVQVVYDANRGEPRGKLKVLGNGDCVDCKRCVAVCPTGIDIRNGLQLDCIGCTACMDACNDIMRKVGKPEGLIRYDAEISVKGGKKKLVRPRTIIYSVVWVLGGALFLTVISGRSAFEAALLHIGSTPYVMEKEEVRNPLRLRVTNKGSDEQTFEIVAADVPDATIIVPQRTVRVKGGGVHEMPIIVTVPRAKMRPFDVEVKVVPKDGGQPIDVAARFLGPGT